MLTERNSDSSTEALYFPKSPDALRTIGEVATELGVASHVLRFWESKFKQIKPQKRRGRRYYRPEDIKVIHQIKVLLYQKGYTIRGVQRFLSHSLHDQSFGNDNAPEEVKVAPLNVSSLHPKEELKALHDNLERFKYKLQNKL